jgi:hypothetical protein
MVLGFDKNSGEEDDKTWTTGFGGTYFWSTHQVTMQLTKLEGQKKNLHLKGGGPLNS